MAKKSHLTLNCGHSSFLMSSLTSKFMQIVFSSIWIGVLVRKNEKIKDEKTNEMKKGDYYRNFMSIFYAFKSYVGMCKTYALDGGGLMF